MGLSFKFEFQVFGYPLAKVYTVLNPANVFERIRLALFEALILFAVYFSLGAQPVVGNLRKAGALLRHEVNDCGQVATENRPDRPQQFYRVVFDERFSSSVAFARDMERLGNATHGTKGDITSFWVHLSEYIAMGGPEYRGTPEDLGWAHTDNRMQFCHQKRVPPQVSVETCTRLPLR
jgi:hypothetical protein